MLSIRYRFLSSQRSLKCELTSLPFWFKRELETLTSFNSVFKDIAKSTINSAIDFDDFSKFKSLVPTCMIKWSGSSLIDGFLSSIHCTCAPGKLRKDAL